MKPKSLLAVALALVLLGAGVYLVNANYQYRSVHGRVTEVNLVSYEQEVASVKDNTPVLIYFYREDEKHPADQAQKSAVDSFAWSYAGKVKVVAINTAHLENLPLAIAHGALRQPGFAILSGEEVIAGPSGAFASKEELVRLFGMVKAKK